MKRYGQVALSNIKFAQVGGSRGLPRMLLAKRNHVTYDVNSSFDLLTMQAIPQS